MKHKMLRAVSAVTLVIASMLAQATNSTETAPSLQPNTKYQLEYTAAVVQFDKALSTSHIAKVVNTFASGESGSVIGVDTATKMLAGDTEFKVHNYAKIITGDGVPGVAAQIATHYIYEPKDSLSPDGMIKTTVARAEPQRVGFELTVNPVALDNLPDNTVSNKALIEHGVHVVGTDKVSTVVTEGESTLGNGSIQVLTWINAGQTFALVLSLDSIQPVK